jgi:hypothetical protein
MTAGGRLGRWCAASAGLAILCARPALAAPAERTFHVEYTAAPDCPEEARFVEALLARAKGAERVAAEEAAIRFRVEIGPSTGTLGVELDEGRSRREISGASCQDLMETLAVIAAMVVEAEPGARLTVTDGVVSDVPEPAPAAPATPLPAPPIAEPPRVEPRPSPVSRSDAAPLPSEARWRLAALVGLATETAVASTPPPGGTLGVELSWRRERAWGFASRLEGFATLPATEQASEGDAELRLATGRGSACGLRGLGAFGLQPCLTLDVGYLWAKGTGARVRNPSEKTMPWIAGGVALSAEYWLGRSVALEAGLGARLLWRRDRFFLEDDSTVYQVPILSFGAQIAAKVAIF